MSKTYKLFLPSLLELLAVEAVFFESFYRPFGLFDTNRTWDFQEEAGEQGSGEQGNIQMGILPHLNASHSKE
jgi:hypothetical protein